LVAQLFISKYKEFKCRLAPSPDGEGWGEESKLKHFLRFPTISTEEGATNLRRDTLQTLVPTRRGCESIALLASPSPSLISIGIYTSLKAFVEGEGWMRGIR